MATVPLFKNRRANCAVVGKSGRTYKFPGSPQGKFWTVDEDSIEELMRLAKKGEGGIYIDPKESEIDPQAATPMDVMRQKIINEYLAEQAKLKDAGDYDASLAAAARSVAGTDESILTGSALASQKNQAAQTGADSPALAAAKAALATKK